MINTQRYMGLARKNIGFFQNFLNLGFIQVSNAVIQILLFPLIIRIVGLESFGLVAVAGTYAALAGQFINYGTNLSGIKDVAIAKNDPVKLASLFYSIYQTRMVLFIGSLTVPLTLYFFSYGNIQYIIFATAIVFAEVLNPLFFFNGIEKLFVFNVANLFAKLLSATLIILFIHSSTGPWWVNFFLGFGNAFFYGILMIYAIRKYKLTWQPFSTNAVRSMIKDNFFLVCNNVSVQLQQSFFLFLISSSASPLTLGAYSLCDKIIASFRLLLIAFSSAIYPKASVTYHEKKEKWPHYKKKINGFLAVVFALTAVALYLLAPQIVLVFTGGHDALAIRYTRCICLVPLAAALNTLNVIELLIRNQYRNLFYCSLALMFVSMITAFLFVAYTRVIDYGFYLVLVETCSLLLFLYFIRRSNKAVDPLTDSVSV